MLVPYSERGSVPVEVVVSQFEDVFGALRSLYASGVPAADALWELMNSAHALDTARYHDQLAPYLEAHELPEPLCTVRTLAELCAAVALAPFARFALASRPEPFDPNSCQTHPLLLFLHFSVPLCRPELTTASLGIVS